MKQLNQIYLQYLDTQKIIKQAIKINRCKINKIITDENIKSDVELRKQLEILKADRSKLFSILIDIEYVISWLKTGHEPENWEGIPNLRVGVGYDTN